MRPRHRSSFGTNATDSAEKGAVKTAEEETHKNTRRPWHDLLWGFYCLGAISLEVVWALFTYDVCIRAQPETETITRGAHYEYKGAPGAFGCILVSAASLFVIMLSSILDGMRGEMYATAAFLPSTSIAYAWYLSTFDNLELSYKTSAPLLLSFPHCVVIMSIFVSVFAQKRKQA